MTDLPLDWAKIGRVERMAKGLFRVLANLNAGAYRNKYEGPTAVALQARSAFDRATEEPMLKCVQDGMPRAMKNPTALELIEGEGTAAAVGSGARDRAV